MTSGIYRIYCTATRRSYVGQAKDIDRRWQQHRNDLNNGKHCNDELQASWKKYGDQSFQWSIVERCREGRLDAAEAYWIRRCGEMNEVRPEAFLYGWWGLIHLLIAIPIGCFIFWTIQPLLPRSPEPPIVTTQT